MTEAISHPIHHDETGRRRVLLKLSGEVFGGGEVGISTEVVRSIAKQIAATVGEVETSIVIGGYGPLPCRLHGYARHRDELPGSAGLPGAGGY